MNRSFFFEDQVCDWGRNLKKLGRKPVPKLPAHTPRGHSAGEIRGFRSTKAIMAPRKTASLL